MTQLILKKCKCCSEEFETNRIDQFFINRLHQVSYNNNKQSNLRKRLAKINTPILKTLRIYKDLLALKSQIRVSKDFLRGKGANIAVFTHLEEIDDKIVNILYDIAIFDQGDYIVLKKYKQC
jgi:hypothetical protein